MMSHTQLVIHTWVAIGPAGAIGTIHQTDEGYSFRLLGSDTRSAAYPSLQIAERALFAALPPGTDWPEFREH
jgi:hypothetical protein